MSDYKLILPAMGEGVMEATVISWLKKVGDPIAEDESVVEIATDKVDSDVPSPVAGVLKEILIDVDGVAKIGEPIAILEIEGGTASTQSSEPSQASSPQSEQAVVAELEKTLTQNTENFDASTSDKFYSPLVKSIAQAENISVSELDQIKGSGKEGRVTKEDLLKFVEDKKSGKASAPAQASTTVQVQAPTSTAQPQVISGGDEIIEMDRMRKMIAQNMVASKQTAPHVTSFIEADVTNIVLWREKNKDEFQKKNGEKITFMPIFIEAIAKAIKDFPMINVSVNGDQIIKKKNINIGMAAALPTGNLIVPVIKNADQYSLAGLAKQVNDLANRSRQNKLKPDEIQGGTYTITNIGSFGNTLGTPIIPQPQVAILAVGAIIKKPAVIETPQGDVIAIRHKMYLSHAYDHRVVDGALGGMFVQRVAQYLEAFDLNTSF
ncbi:dihydrolipoamide acetyltransferase family protein [Moheibacter sediminis]|uniref:Dihydrolipoamide acetyltransferase component of pyruvate dehydrogenase complex n=1 Tax=Moheibacter sediminis TaxID=1434700 RepID=A0A1W1ZWZ8_9FLAO|nr:dihydrolipoamide acetyltransferase family protein [Moheibacter sediminis]SMC52598.1 2-oxoglutarate dehydrogenase E2 component (dihydrolipoamide succinyltransferase) [Moheibacter sediminis]